jgi:hypothetical protein
VAARAERNDLEQRVRAAVRRGELFDCAPSGATPFDLDAVDDWDLRIISAELFVELCSQPGACDPQVGVRIRGAHISGIVDLAHADVQIPLGLQVCRFDQDVDLSEAHIRSMSAERCAITALYADELESDHSLDFNNSGLGQVSVIDARIRGGLDLSYAKLGPAFYGDHLSATGSASFKGAEVTGELVLRDAQIGGQLDMTDAKLTNDDGSAFTGDRVSATGGAFFKGAEVTGELRLAGAQIGDPLDMRDAKLTTDHGPACYGDHLSATGSASFKGAEVTGELRLSGAQIGGQLDMRDAKLTNDHGSAFTGDNLSTADDASFAGAEVTGELRLAGAQIGAQLDMTGATLTNDGGLALMVNEMQSGTWFLQTRAAIRGDVDLRRAVVGSLVDNLSSWPKRVYLEGFSYRNFTGAKDRDVASRLAWVRRNRDYSPAVYDQLVEVYRRAGQDQDARQVAISREDDRRRYGQLSLPSKTWNKFLGLTVAHGYKPWRAAVFLLVVIAVSTWLFLRPSAEAAMAPTKAVEPAPTADECGPGYECFEPWLYGVDVLLPVVDLHQESSWLPSADRPWGDWYRALTWGLIAIGWLLTTALVAAIGTVWRR